MDTSTTPWWQGAVGYQIYIRSFQDSDGDGAGDLPGILERLDHLVALGVDIVWITPFYPSPQADHGYDVADYTGIDPAYGTIEDFDRLLDAVHARNLKLVVDLVPNHSSDHHPWFVAALEARDTPTRDFYVWRDPAPDGGPPNNWVSHFGGPAWTLDEASEQYYMHLFLPEQPDLNWANPAVADEFDEILTFWLERGVDGFRIDVAHSMVEDPDFRDNPFLDGPPAEAAGPREIFAAYDHQHDLDQPGVIAIYQRWNAIAAEYDAVLIGEVYLLDAHLLTRYVADRDGLHAAFCFSALQTGWDAQAIRTTLVDAVAAGTGALAWPLSSHDDPHAASRFGGGDRGGERALAYFALLASLPGMAFLFQGDELGLDDGDVGAAQDPIAVRNEGAVGRDGSRTPMPWEPGPGLGFTTAATPWLGFGTNRTDADTAAVQDADPASILNRCRALLRLRRDWGEVHGEVGVDWLDTAPSVIALRRGDLVVAMHVGDDKIELDLPAGSWRPSWCSSTGAVADATDGATATATVTLGPDETVILVRARFRQSRA